MPAFLVTMLPIISAVIQGVPEWVNDVQQLIEALEGHPHPQAQQLQSTLKQACAAATA